MRPGKFTLLTATAAGLLLVTLAWAQQNDTATDPLAAARAALKREGRAIGAPEPLTYTLGPDDVVEITVRKHPEFSGAYVIGRDGKIQYRFVGDIPIGGLTKGQLADRIKELIAQFVIEPEVEVIILEFRSKVVYVVGEVGGPGRYFLRAENVPLREVLFEAGLPTLAAAMRRAMIIHAPEEKTPRKPKVDNVNVYALIYLGDMTRNVPIRAGDILYVPSTVFYKATRILNPMLDPIYRAAVARNLVE